MIIMLPIHSFPRTHTHIHHDPLMLTRYDRNVVRHAARPSPEKVKVEELPPWINEPERVDDLLKLYNIEAKVPGRTAGTTLYLVSATRRDGTTDARKKLQCILGFPGLGVGMALVLRICIELSFTQCCQVPTLDSRGPNSGEPGVEAVSRALDF